MKTGVQQYMLREHFKTDKEALETLKKAKATGYDGIELCGFLMEPSDLPKGTPMEVKEKYDWQSLVKQAGIEVCSIHELMESMLKNLEPFIKKAESLGTNYMVAAATFETDFRNLESVKKFVCKMQFYKT